MQGLINPIQRTATQTQGANDRPLGVMLLSFSLGLSGGLCLLALLIVLRVLTFWDQLTGILSIILALPFASHPASTSSLPGNTSYDCSQLGPNCTPGNVTPGGVPLPDGALSILLIIGLSLLAFLYLALARGLWKLDLKAYWGTIALQAISIVASVIYFSSHSGLQVFASCYLSIVIILYLLAFSGVRRAFRLPF